MLSYLFKNKFLLSWTFWIVFLIPIISYSVFIIFFLLLTISSYFRSKFKFPFFGGEGFLKAAIVTQCYYSDSVTPGSAKWVMQCWAWNQGMLPASLYCLSGTGVSEYLFQLHIVVYDILCFHLFPDIIWFLCLFLHWPSSYLIYYSVSMYLWHLSLSIF